MHSRGIILFVSLLATSVASAAPVDVVATPQTTSTTRFNRNDRPKEMGGKNGEMTGLTVWRAGIDFTYGYTFTSVAKGDHSVIQLRLSTVKFTLNQDCEVWLPQDCGKDLVDHENGHVALASFGYEQLIQRTPEFGKTLLRQTFEGATEDDAKQRVNEYVERRLRKPYFELLGRWSQAFDNLTKGGLNQTITVRAAVRRVINEDH